MFYVSVLHFFFFFNDTATTEIYTLSLHDALPIFWPLPSLMERPVVRSILSALKMGTHSGSVAPDMQPAAPPRRSEEHTSELQSQSNLVCRLLLEKKKKTKTSVEVHHTDHQVLILL